MENVNHGMIRYEKRKNDFESYVKKVEDEETKLLKLQAEYRSGKIKEEDLTEAQVEQLCALYDRQIEALRKSNRMRMQKLLQYRMRNRKSC